MADLFSNIETKKSKKIKGSLFSKTEDKVVYKALDGRFTDRETARLANIEKERDRYKTSSEYWKRQTERLSEDYKTEHKRVQELEKELKRTPNP